MPPTKYDIKYVMIQRVAEGVDPYTMYFFAVPVGDDLPGVPFFIMKKDKLRTGSGSELFFIGNILHNIFNITIQYFAEHLYCMSADTFVSL